MEWTTEKVAALARDAASIKRGKKLAINSKWSSIACNGNALWGAFKGAGSAPYHVKIDLSGPAYSCSCPVHQLPCKHILGLFFLYAQSASQIPRQEPPAWVAGWINQREGQHKPTTKPLVQKSAEELDKARKAKEKRAAQKMARMRAGIDELEQWLLDLVRQGFANVDIQQMEFWQLAAAKMVDAHLPRVSYFMKETAAMALKSTDWMNLVTARLGKLHLLVQAFRNLDAIPDTMKEEVFNMLGRSMKKADVLEQNPQVEDHWVVLAQKEAIDLEGRKLRRVWIQGINSQRNALILDYSFGNAGFDNQYVVGSVLEAKLAFYPAAYPQRAVLADSKLVDFKVEPLHRRAADFEAFLNQYADALAENPWITQDLIILDRVWPFQNEKGQYLLMDAQQKILPLANLKARVIWKLLAMSGGQPIQVIGEWDGQHFEALSIYQQQKIEAL